MFGISADIPVDMDDFFNALHSNDRDRIATVDASATEQACHALYDV